jgi:hypothetical protein
MFLNIDFIGQIMPDKIFKKRGEEFGCMWRCGKGQR